MAVSTVNYRELFFEHPDLTKIIGIPTYDTLHQLHQELKANAMSVHSTLGGSQHGHLGLLMSQNAYALLSNTPFVIPEYPGELIIPAGATRHAQDLLERNHKEALRKFHEVRGVERALIQQVVSAVHPQYIAAMRNRSTGQFTATINQLVQYLLNVYGKITPAQLLELEHETKTLSYDPITPIDVVFNQVEDLIEYGEMANNGYTMIQTVNMAYAILNRTTKFRESIKAWNKLAPLNKTWITFKLHFREAHNELMETGELTMSDVGYNQANLAEDIASRIAELHLDRSPSYQTPPDKTALSVLTPTTATEPLLSTILQQMQQMQQMMLAMQQTATTPPAGATRQPHPSTGPRQGQPSRPLPAWATKYCHTHGRCSHLGTACNNKAPGHQDAATMEHKMGGSTYGCT